MTNLIQAAMDAVEAARPKAEGDPNRPVFHFRPTAQHMNDVCGALHYKGWYHIFYQFAPYHSEGGVHTGWGHARSRDLVYWEHLPIAIMPDGENGERLYASGSAVLDGKGNPIIFFGWTLQAVWDGTAKREQWAAVPVDDELIEWRTMRIGLRPGESGVPADIRFTWTDMFVFRSGERTFATFKSSKGLVCEALNPELTRWQAVGNLDGVIGECPNFFRLGTKWILIQSMSPISYQLGQFDPETIQFTADAPACPLDYGFGLQKPPSGSAGLYGTTATVDDSGRTLFFGFISGFEEPRGWNNCMILPRVLSLDEDGGLIQTPVEELQRLRGKPVKFSGIGLDNESSRLAEISGDCLEIQMTLVPGENSTCGIRVRCGDDGNESIQIRAHRRCLNVAGTEVPNVHSGRTHRDKIDLHLFLDKAALEVFIDGGRKTVTRAIQADPQNLGVEFFAEGGAAQLRDVTIWPTKRIWPR